MAPDRAERRLEPALARRIASGVVLAALATAAVLLGGAWLALLVLLGLALAAREWAALATGASSAGRALLLLAPLLVGGAAGLAVVAGAGGLAWPILLLGAPLAAALAALLPGGVPHRTGLGVLYLGLPAALLLWLRQEPRGAALVLWLMAVVAATDTLAYAAGRTIGGARLAPAISPGKTWAGLLGGFAGAVLVGALGAPALDWSHAAAGVLGGVLGLVAQAGDLLESWLKRRAGVKDSGTLLPGHGGVLDRIDGLLVATPALALFLALGR
jgi:phosphatidate cytidylyltransferase